VYEVSSPLVFDYWDRQTEKRTRYRDRSTLIAARSVATPILTATAVNSVERRQVPEDIEEQIVTFYPPDLSS